MWFRGKHKFDLYLRYYPRNIADHQESQAWQILFPINIELIFTSAFWFFTSKPPAYLFNGLLLLVWLIFFLLLEFKFWSNFCPYPWIKLRFCHYSLNSNTLNLCPISLSKLYHTLYSQIQYPPIENFLTSHHLLTWQPVNGVKRHAFWSLLEETRFALHLFLLNFQKNTYGDLSPTPNPFFFYLWSNNHLMTTSTQSLRKQNIMTETFSPCLMKQTKDVSPSIYK